MDEYVRTNSFGKLNTTGKASTQHRQALHKSIFLTTTRFPSAAGGNGFLPLSRYVHSLGLRFGIHIMRGIPRLAVRKNLPIWNSPYTAG